MSTRPELLHVGIFAIFAKAGIAFVRSGFGYHDCRSLIGKPGPVELRGRKGHRWSQHVILAPSSSLSAPHLVAGSSLEAQQQVEKRQMPPRMESREALQPK